MGNKISPGLLRKFLRDECDENEYRQVIHWVNSSSNEEEVLAFLESYWIAEKGELNIDYDKVLGKIKNDIASGNRGLKTIPIRYSITRHLIKIAAVLLLPALILGIYLLAQKSSENTGIAYEQKVNKRGQKSKISLPDGTMVWLNSESRLRYLKDFSDNNREVILDGEAFFEVVKNEDLPFKVITGQIETIALGTSFNINSFPENKAVGISLVTGKVMVNHQIPTHSLEAVILNPGEKLQFDRVTNNFRKVNFDFKKEVAWRQGVIYFDNADIGHVRATLERWFNVDIVFKNQAKRPWHYSGEFDNSSLERVLERMAYTEEFGFQLSGNTVTIEFK